MQLLLLDLLEVSLEVLSPSELLKHNHLTFSLVWSLFEEASFLFILGQINNVSPSLFVFGFEVLQELIETLISLCHAFN